MICNEFSGISIGVVICINTFFTYILTHYIKSL